MPEIPIENCEDMMECPKCRFENPNSMKKFLFVGKGVKII